MYKNISTLSNVELPMVFIANSISPIFQIVYSLVLLAAIYSTSAGNLYGFASRILDIEGPKGKILVSLVAILAFIAGQFGFANLIKYMYPIEGYLGVILLGGLLYSKVKFSG